MNVNSGRATNMRNNDKTLCLEGLEWEDFY